SPRNPKQKIIKRVIGLEGDFIRTLSYKNRYVRVPDGHLWIEGDHRGHSLDSNCFGPVSLGLLHGRASHIIWPPNRYHMAQQTSAGRRYVKTFISGFFVAVPVTVTILDKLAYVARVEGASMQPFLNPDVGAQSDVVLLNRWSVRNYQVQRGDIVSV
ncbi:hypothetical protein CCH79_00016602, partial [Gambusia affinis]